MTYILNARCAMEGSRLRRPAQLIGVTLVVLAGAVLYTYRNIRRCAALQPSRGADTIIVLGAGARGGQPTAVYRNRLDHALELYRSGPAAHIVVTERAPAAQAARRYLVANGVPREAIALEDRSATTWENLYFAREVMCRHDWHTAIIVSCPFHLHRALRMARDLGMPVQGAAAVPCLLESPPRSHVRWTLRECRLCLTYSVLAR